MSYEANATIEQWLAQEEVEGVLEPELAIVDPHHHLWDIRTATTQPHRSFQQKVYLCEDIALEIERSGHNVVQTVFAQCGAFYRASGPEELKCVGETEFVHGVVAMSNSGIYGNADLCAGIFGSADLRVGSAVKGVLQAHLNASDNFRGVRTAFPSDLNDQFLDGYAELSKLRLSYDNYSPDFERLPTLAKLADKNTDTTVIVNHLGGNIDANADPETVKRWQAGIDAIAASPNAVMKCGGAQMRSGKWEPEFHMNKRQNPIGSEELCETLFPYYEYAINAFGPDRCMFESNFPVDRECISYRTLWNAFKRIADRLGLSETEKAAIFSGTARRAYQLAE
ncbi:MAG: amidohydrolase family protein [Pseudomonadales bacterium]|nr:amidohydrolase family protein [Pseudomonadales bacterium]